MSNILRYLFDWLPYLVAVLVIVAGYAYVYITRKHSYWKIKGVPYIEPSLIFGNLKDVTLQRTSLGELLRQFYDKFEGHKFGGIYFFQRPVFIVRDPELLKLIMVKDFAHFQNHENVANEEADPLMTKHLVALEGLRWRNMRIKLAPTFTSGKMKKMYQFVNECGEELKKYLEGPAIRGDPIEVKELVGRYTTDAIATCAFGIQLNSIKNPDNEFRTMSKEITAPPGFIKGLKFLLMMTFPKKIKLNFSTQKVTDFLRNLVKETMDYREKNNIVRKDFLDQLIKLKNQGKVDIDEDDEKEIQSGYLPSEEVNIELSHDDLTAQAFIFLFAGMDTSASALNFALYEMALHQEIQKTLQKEIDEAMKKCEGKLTYQVVMQEMSYLNKVVSETLRKYPPSVISDRMCNKQYTIPGTNVTLERGQKLMIPIYGFHMDPKYFPDPEKFDPERFSEENKGSRPAFSYIPFGEGPRMCIGNRFALMQFKVCLTSILSTYEVHTCEKTSIPLDFDPKSFFLVNKGGTWLKFVKRAKI